VQFTRLRLAGFKSFVEPTELLIEPGLTGIVGPNGCGKSNLVEALRWVMGESSARGLRGGEMDDVIFAGTRGRASFDLAEVVVQLRADGFHVPGLGDVEELELARRIGRGAGSCFRLNGREVRARDVQLLFADAASGARSAAIISQGQIGSLVEAKPAERRRLLEDAAGIGGLQARRHEAELKLQASEANLARVEDLIGELGEQHARLRKQARQAMRYRELSAACRDALAALLAARLIAARATRDRLHRELTQADQGVRAADDSIAEARADREARGVALEAARTAVAEAGAEQARLAERLAAAEREAAREAERRAELEARAAEAGLDLARAERELADARRTLVRLDAEAGEVDEAIRADEDRLEATLAALSQAQQRADVAEATFREQLAKTTALETELRHHQALASQASELRAHLAAEVERVARALADLPEPPAALEGDCVAAAEQALAASLATNEAAQDEVAAAECRAEEARAARAAAEARVADLAGRQRAKEAAVARFESEQDRLGKRRAELDERLERLAGRALRLADRAHEREAQAAALGLEKRRAEAAEADARLDAAQRVRAASVDDLAAAEAGAARLTAECAQLREQLQGLSAERRALDQLVVDGAGFAPVLDRIEIDEGFADALAAALGDDLLASLEPAAPSRWDGAVAALPGPALPAGTTPLAAHVRAPAELARRLAQVGLVADDETGARLAPALAQGQRLVSRAGALWRWDGFRRRPEGADQAAGRLRQAQRRQTLDREIETLQAATGSLDAELQAAIAETGARRQAAEAAALAADQAREEAERTARALIQAEAGAGSLTSEIEGLRLEAESVEGERGELVAEREQVEQELAALGDAPADDPGPRQALAAAEHDSRTLAETHAGALDASAAARRVADEARRNVAKTQAELAEAREAARQAADRRREQAEARARHEVEAGRLAERLSASEADETAALGSVAELEPALAAARSTLQAAETGAETARRQLAEASAEQSRLEDRLRAQASRRTMLADERLAWERRLGERAVREDELRGRAAALQAEVEGLAAMPAAGQPDHHLKAALGVIEARLAELETERAAAEAGLAEAEARLSSAERSRGERREAIARHEAELEAAEAAFEAAARALAERELAPPAADLPIPDGARIEDLEATLTRAEAARERLGPVNLRAVDEVAETEMRLDTLTSERDELVAAIERLRRGIATLNREGRERLRVAFGAIEQHFEALFVRLFGGGEARLALTDLEDPLAAGLEVMASPPGKKLQSLTLLSGGEKALTALALVFAVFLTRPSPLCILDEVDAPLDDANVERLALLLEELAGGTATRFVVVTHHPLTMAHMDRLYGVTMLERGVSRLVSVDLRAAEELRATA
jgi:chromosome segregation protein